MSLSDIPKRTSIFRGKFSDIEVYVIPDPPSIGTEVTFYFVNTNPENNNPFFKFSRKCWDGSLAREDTYKRMPSTKTRKRLLRMVFNTENIDEIYNKIFK